MIRFFSARLIFYVEAERFVGRYVFHENAKHVRIFKICISGTYDLKERISAWTYWRFHKESVDRLLRQRVCLTVQPDAFVIIRVISDGVGYEMTRLIVNLVLHELDASCVRLCISSQHREEENGQ